jgi:23S rRNA pseudouridine955/2504/2580 synthase/23S rRNA pseudouridine1911/1915/1917 synthase
MVAGRDAVPAQTRYEACGFARDGAAVLALAPMTGRTHQIRVHAANAGAPLVGDVAYGGAARVTLASGRVVEPRRVALHAARVVVPDEDGGPLAIVAPIPSALVELWSNLGGDAAAWELATSCALV